MTKIELTRAAKERAYRALLSALAERRAVCGMTDAEFSEQANEIWADCFVA